MTEPVWMPTTPEQSQMYQFMQTVNHQFSAQLQNYQDLYRWSITHPHLFWQHVAQNFNVELHGTYSRVLTPHHHMLKAKWFEGATLNFARHFLRHRSEKTAIIAYDECSRRRSLSFAELNRQVMQLAYHFQTIGLKPGDRVAGILPNIPEAIIAMLATASLGAIWSCCSPDFGYQGIMDRLTQIEPTLLVASDGHYYNGKTHCGLSKIAQLSERLNGVRQTLIIPFIHPNPKLDGINSAIAWQDCLNDDTPVELTTYPFAHPLYILFSSGTTGKPKCITHGVGGTLLQHLKELALHTDLNAEDNLFFYTTCGWMMWNWMASALMLGTTITLYDGNPMHPGTNRLFDILTDEKVTVFGTSAKFISAVEKEQYHPNQHHQFPHLKTILSTGSPLLPSNYDFVYHSISKTVQLSSISGGTDIISCFALGNPLTPVYRGELQCIGLGMNVEVYDEQSHSVTQQKGELVCTRAFPSMPVGFWNDLGQKKYFDAYFRRYENVWAHGDYAEITKHHGLIIYGRSDAVLNPGGVRIGTAEIYRQVEKIPQIKDSVVIGQQYHDDVRVVLFVQLQAGVQLDEALITHIKATIRQNATPRHVPAKIIAVTDIPRTRSGKIVELAIKETVEGRPVNNIEALENPNALKQYANHPELR